MELSVNMMLGILRNEQQTQMQGKIQNLSFQKEEKKKFRHQLMIVQINISVYLSSR